MFWTAPRCPFLIPWISGQLFPARYLLRFAQYSGFPCVVKSWRGISCNLSSAQPETWDLHAVKDFRANYGGKEKWFFIHFIFNVNPLILESFDTWLKMCTVALSFSPSHCLQWIYTDAADAVSFQPWIASETGHSWGGNIFETCLSICKAGDYGLAPEQQKQKKQSTSGCLDIFQW